MQTGGLIRASGARGTDDWEYRWREPGPEGKLKHRRLVIGSLDQFRDRSAAVLAIAALRREINLADPMLGTPPITISQLAGHYRLREINTDNQWKTDSTKVTKQHYLHKWIVSRSRNYAHS